MTIIDKVRHAPVAQLDRAPDYESGGQEFESLRARHRQMLDPSKAFSEALDLHRKGNLAAAEALYGRIIKLQPDHFDTLHLFGMLRCQQGRFAEGLSLIGSALQRNPDFPPALMNYGRALDALKRPEEALAAFDRALAVEPNQVEVL